MKRSAMGLRVGAIGGRALSGRALNGRALGVGAACATAMLLCNVTLAQASLIIDPTFASSITTDADSAAIESAIDSAITATENAISTSSTVSIYFQEMSSGLGESETSTYDLSYYQYYNSLKRIDTAPTATVAQQTAFASLGPAPTNSSSGNPVNGGTVVYVTSAEGRVLGLNTPAAASAGGQNYDGIISLNTSLTSPPGSPSGSYSLQAVAQHEIDEILGIGGSGSELGNGSVIGPLDLYRYSAAGVRSFSTSASSAYFSIDGGDTVLSYFNQVAGADYGDWESDPIPNGFSPQVQDAFGTEGTDPTLGPNELTAFNVVGYTLTTQENAPEPMSLAIMLPGVLGLVGLRRRGARSRAD